MKLFIVLEGPDGSGKSTIANMLIAYLEEKGVKSVLTREPGGTSIGEDIRKILLSNENDEMKNRTEALLYAAARAQHVEEKIKPLLEMDNIVISDRYVFSSLAYQGFARGVGIDEVMKINEFAMNNIYPDLILFFDISPEVALSRKFQGREADRIENAGDEFHKKVYKGYYEIIKKYKNNVVIINANGAVEETFEQCKKVIDKICRNRRQLCLEMWNKCWFIKIYML